MEGLRGLDPSGRKGVGTRPTYSQGFLAPSTPGRAALPTFEKGLWTLTRVETARPYLPLPALSKGKVLGSPHLGGN